MSRTGQILVIVLLAAVVALGALLIARNRQVPEPAPAGLIVYAPCGMTSPLTSAVHLFRQAHPKIDLNIIYDNAIVLVRKIRGGDRPDVFVSPGELEMRQMVDEGYVDPQTVRDFGTLDLVVIAPTKTKGLDTLEDLKGPTVKTISLAHPDYNSVGYYGRKALESLGLWEPLKSKILLREYPLEAVTLVTQGQVDAGLTYLTCPLDTAPDKADKSDVRIVAAIPRDSYPPVRCQIGVLREAGNRAFAQQLVDFMLSDEAQQAVATHGLQPAKEIR
jgi:molybdate transport system substrate-binding protein